MASQQVRWRTFAISSAITKTALHFFPSAQSTSAPYPVLVKLTAFAKDFPAKSLVIEGGRLGQPDGFRLEEAFPTMTELLPGFVGLEVELSSPQPRIDLSPSHLIMEIFSTAQSVKFSPSKMPPGTLSKDTAANEERSDPGVLPALHDAYGIPSLLVLNSSERSIQPFVGVSRYSGDGLATDRINALEVAAGEISEITIPEQFFKNQEPDECSWGLLRGRIVTFERFQNPAICLFGLHRESVTKRIVSVLPL